MTTIKLNPTATVSNETTKTEEMVSMVNVSMKMNEVIAIAKAAGVTFKVGMTKDMLVTAIQSATAETSVAEPIKEEVIHMDQVLKDITARKNDLAMDRWSEKTTKGGVAVKEKEVYVNKTRQSLYDSILAAAVKYQDVLGELPIEVVNIHWNINAKNELVPVGKNRNKYGWVHILVTRGVLQFHAYNAAIKKFEWKDFADFDLDAAGVNKDLSLKHSHRIDTFHPIAGSGSLVLPIYFSEGMGGFFTMLPNVPMQDGSFRPIFKTGDYRWNSFSVKNNGRVNAAISAYVRATQSQLTYVNPANRHGFNESCMTCQYMTYLGVKDGVNDDLETKKSHVVLNQLSIEQLAQNGQYQPQAYCSVFSKMVDAEAMTALNEALGADRTAVEFIEEINEDGAVSVNYRYPTKGQVILHGKIVNIADIRKDATKTTCESCPFYHKTEKKGQARINADQITANEAGVVNYESKYFTEMAHIERQAVQVETSEGWVTASPGDVENALDLRVKGLGGVMIYTHPQYAETLNQLGALTSVIPVHEYDIEKAQFENKLQSIFNAARDLASLTTEKANDVFALALAKPAGISERDSKRWDRAVEWLRQSVIWAQERADYVNRTPFAIKFIVAQNGVHVDNVLTETRFREEEGAFEANVYVNSFASSESMSYRTLTNKEFVKFLDEGTALDLVDDVILTGESIYITGDERELEKGERQDAELVAGALQHMLDAQVSNFLYGVRRAEDPKAALEKLKVSKEVKDYIASIIKL